MENISFEIDNVKESKRESIEKADYTLKDFILIALK